MYQNILCGSAVKIIMRMEYFKDNINNDYLYSNLANEGMDSGEYGGLLRFKS